jgi:hypothetical protein
MAGGYYPDTCDSAIPSHNCDPCADREHGRIQAVAYVKDSYTFLDPESATEWELAIQNGDVILIPAVHGSLPEPSEKLGTGYGKATETLLGFEYALQYFDPNYAENCDFYNALKRSQGYKLMYKTETLGHLTDVTVTVIPKQPVEDDLNAEVVWVVTVKWKDSDHPCPFVFPESVLECYIQGGV